MAVQIPLPGRRPDAHPIDVERRGETHQAEVERDRGRIARLGLEGWGAIAVGQRARALSQHKLASPFDEHEVTVRIDLHTHALLRAVPAEGGQPRVLRLQRAGYAGVEPKPRTV